MTVKPSSHASSGGAFTFCWGMCINRVRKSLMISASLNALAWLTKQYDQWLACYSVYVCVYVYSSIQGTGTAYVRQPLFVLERFLKTRTTEVYRRIGKDE